ncbi:MAG TPA: hypothetical protein EYP22_11205 [Methanosarcinales archaeon]|nr:hypothetical protein [Methanosarcinales archaeon]
MKTPKINLNKIDKLTEDWAEKSMADPDLPWETAMNNAAEELGLNKEELVALVFGREVFNSLAY